MRNNKGYTLVELIVAVAILLVVMAEVGALMVNSQQIYKNGFYDINVQEEAQQVVQQIEDLLINASTKVNYEKVEHTNTDGVTIRSDVIIIDSAIPALNSAGYPTGDYVGVTYRIGLAFDVNNSGKYPDGTPVPSDEDFGMKGHEYEMLVMERTLHTADDGDKTTYAPMAEGVRSVRIDNIVDAEDPDNEPATNYYEADYITLWVEMQNKKYSYSTETASTNIYLRNTPGTGGTARPGSSGVTTETLDDITINVRRCHTYDLRDYVDPKYKYFRFPVANSSFNLSGGADSENYLLQSSLNNSWGTEVGLTLIEASEDDTFSVCKKLYCYTEKVSAMDMPLYVYDNMTAMCTSTFPITGICADCASKDLQFQIFWEEYPTDSSYKYYYYDKDNATWKLEQGTGSALTYQEFDKNHQYISEDDMPYNASGLGAADLPEYPLDIVVGAGDEAEPHASGTKSDSVKVGFGDGFCYLGDYQFFGQFGAVYNYGTFVDDKTNSVIMTTTSHSTEAKKYWNFVEKTHGYIRVEFYLTWPGVTNALKFYGYYFPQQSGDEDQRELIYERIMPAEAAKQTQHVIAGGGSGKVYDKPHMEVTGITYSGGTGTITLKNSGASDTTASWSAKTSVTDVLSNITSKDSNYTLAYSGGNVKVTSSKVVKAGDSVTIAFDYTEVNAILSVDSATIAGGNGKIVIKNSGTTSTYGSWDIDYTAAIKFSSVVTGDYKYSISASGKNITVTSEEAIPAGGSIEVNFTYEELVESMSVSGATFTDYYAGSGACTVNLTYSGNGVDNSQRPITVVVVFGDNIVSCEDSKVIVSGSTATYTSTMSYNKWNTNYAISFNLVLPNGYSGTPTATVTIE